MAAVSQLAAVACVCSLETKHSSFSSGLNLYLGNLY